MIKVEDVGQETYNKIEGSIWRNVQRIMGYDWYNAGRAVHVAPSEHEMIEYGRDWALARYFQDGGRWQDAVEEATKAVYRYAYDDIKPYIVYRPKTGARVGVRTMIYDMSETGQVDGTGTESTRFTTFSIEDPIYQQIEYDEIEFQSLLESLPLNDLQRQITLLKAHGLSNKDTAEYLGFSRQWITDRWAKTLVRLRRHYEQIL